MASLCEESKFLMKVEKESVSMTGNRADIDQVSRTEEEETAQIMYSQNGCSIKRVKVAREYFLPEYPKEILEMGLR